MADKYAPLGICLRFSSFSHRPAGGQPVIGCSCRPRSQRLVTDCLPDGVGPMNWASWRTIGRKCNASLEENERAILSIVIAAAATTTTPLPRREADRDGDDDEDDRSTPVSGRNADETDTAAALSTIVASKATTNSDLLAATHNWPCCERLKRQPLTRSVINYRDAPETDPR